MSTCHNQCACSSMCPLNFSLNYRLEKKDKKILTHKGKPELIPTSTAVLFLWLVSILTNWQLFQCLCEIFSISISLEMKQNSKLQLKFTRYRKYIHSLRRCSYLNLFKKLDFIKRGGSKQKRRQRQGVIQRIECKANMQGIVLYSHLITSY